MYLPEKPAPGTYILSSMIGTVRRRSAAETERKIVKGFRIERRLRFGGESVVGMGDSERVFATIVLYTVVVGC